jgi:hypothetical protein
MNCRVRLHPTPGPTSTFRPTPSISVKMRRLIEARRRSWLGMARARYCTFTYHAWYRKQDADDRDAGISLIDDVVVLIILPIIIIALATAFFVATRTSTYVVLSSTESTAAQVAANLLQQDTDAAQVVTASSTQQQCGPGTQVLGLAWGGAPNNLVSASVVSYSLVTNNTLTGLWRYYCAAGPSVIPSNSTLLTGYSSSITEAATILPAGTSQTTWVAVGAISGVQLTFNTPDGSWPVTLVAAPPEPTTG